jgi:hypothetical protein
MTFVYIVNYIEGNVIKESYMNYYINSFIINIICYFFIFAINAANAQNDIENINALESNSVSSNFNNNLIEKDPNVRYLGNHIVYRVNITNSTSRVLNLEFAQDCHYLFKLNNNGDYIFKLRLNPGQSSGALYSYDYKELECLAPSYIGRNIAISFKYDNDIYPSYIVQFHTEYHGASSNENEVFYFIDGRNDVTGDFLNDLQKVASAYYYGNGNIRNKISYIRQLGNINYPVIYDYNIDVLKDLVIDNDNNISRYIKAFISPYK